MTTTPTAPTEDDYTVDDLLAMDDVKFAEAVTEDLQFTGQYDSAFQDDRVARRTLNALLDKVWFIDATLRRNAEDPSYPADRWSKTQGFRRFLLAAVDITEKRLEWGAGLRARETRAWRATLNELIDAVEGTPLDHVLDEIKIPFDNMTLRTWVEVRRVKQVQRAPQRDAA